MIPTIEGKGPNGGLTQDKDTSTKKAKSMRKAEIRRQKSKVAARCRRGKEAKIFDDLCTYLPLPPAAKGHLDKVSVVRLTLCDLGLKKIMKAAGFPPNRPLTSDLNGVNEVGLEFESKLNQAMGGFILVFGLDGDVIYASEGVMDQLGISQLELMGHSIFEFSHQYDHPEIRSMFLMTPKKNTGSEGQGDEGQGQTGEVRSSFFRMKCSVASTRGRNESHHLCSNYKMVNCIGRIVAEGPRSSGSSGVNWFISICEPLLHPSDSDIPLNATTFRTRHSPDMKFILDEGQGHNDDLLFGYRREDLIGASLFEFIHAADGDAMSKAFKFLTDKEQNQTEPYRFLTQGGGWVKVITQATLIHGSGCGGCSVKSPDYVICIHWMTSEREEQGQILSLVQMGTDDYVSPAGSGVGVDPTDLSSDLSLVERDMLEIRREMDNSLSTTEMSPDEENAIIADLLVEPYFGVTGTAPQPFQVNSVPDGFLVPGGGGEEDALMTSDPEDLTLTLTQTGDEFSVPPHLDVALLQNLLASLDVEDILELEAVAGDPILASVDPPTPPLSREGGGQDQGQSPGQELNLVPPTVSPVNPNLTPPPVESYILTETPSPGVGPPPTKLQLMGLTNPPGQGQGGQVGGSEGEGFFMMLVPVVVSPGQGQQGSTGDSNHGSPTTSSTSLDSAGQLDLVNLVRAQALQIQQQAEINRELLARIELFEEGSTGVRRNSIGKRNSSGSLLSQQQPQQPPMAITYLPGQGQDQGQGQNYEVTSPPPNLE